MARHHYVGKAGHLAVMSELTWRGYNVAMPEIDVGDDVFAVNNETGALRRVQVKTSSGKRQATSSAYQFSVREDAITTPMTPDMWFVFVLRVPEDPPTGLQWRFVIVSRQVLHDWTRRLDFGTLNGLFRQVNFTLHDDGRLIGSREDVSTNLDQWHDWPVVGV